MSLEDLRALAEAATPGPWEAYFTQHGDPFVSEAGRGWFGALTVEPGEDDQQLGIAARVATGPADYGRANCLFIAAANPAVVMALIDELAEYRALGPLPSLRVAIAHSEAIDAQIALTAGATLAPDLACGFCAQCRAMGLIGCMGHFPGQTRSAGHPTEPNPVFAVDAGHLCDTCGHYKVEHRDSVGKCLSDGTDCDCLSFSAGHPTEPRERATPPQPTVERWLFLALLVEGAHPDHDPDDLASDVAWSVNKDGRLGTVTVGGIPAPQWLTPETLANLRAAASGDAS